MCCKKIRDFLNDSRARNNDLRLEIVMRCINCGSTESFICGECYHIDMKKLKEEIEYLQKK
jgi:hypothetical protein